MDQNSCQSEWNLSFCRLFLCSLALFFKGSFNGFDYAPMLMSGNIFQAVGLFRFLPFDSFSPQTIEVCSLLWKGSLFLSAIGLFTNFSLLLAFVSGMVVTGGPYCYGEWTFGGHLLIICLLVLAFSKCGSLLSVDHFILKKYKYWPVLRSSPHDNFLYPVFLIKCLIAFYYFSAGYTKIVNDGFEWFYSFKLHSILFRVPAGGVLLPYLLKVPWLIHLISVAVILIELTSFFSLFGKRLGQVYVVGWALLHLGITLTLGMHYFFLFNIVCFCFYINWYKFFVLKKREWRED